MNHPPFLSSSRGRILGISGLLVLHLVLMVWFGSLSPTPDLGIYPGNEELGTDYDPYSGKHVTVNGRVINTEPVLIAADYGVDDSLTLRVAGIRDTVKTNQYLRVYGIAQSDRSIAAIRSVTVQPAGLVYTYSVSFLAGLWVLGRIIQHWRFDPDSLGLEPRAEPISLRQLLNRLGRDRNA